MRKRYFVLMSTNRFAFTVNCNSIKIATWLMNLKVWKYAKIHDTLDGHKCIKIKRRA